MESKFKAIAQRMDGSSVLDARSATWLSEYMQERDSAGPFVFGHLESLNLTPLHGPIRVVVFNAIFHKLELGGAPVDPWQPNHCDSGMGP